MNPAHPVRLPGGSSSGSSVSATGMLPLASEVRVTTAFPLTMLRAVVIVVEALDRADDALTFGFTASAAGCAVVMDRDATIGTLGINLDDACDTFQTLQVAESRKNHGSWIQAHPGMVPQQWKPGSAAPTLPPILGQGAEHAGDVRTLTLAITSIAGFAGLRCLVIPVDASPGR